MPSPWRERFDATLRSSLKQRLQRLEQLDLALSPQAVRSQAVSTWRKRYMKGASRGAQKRMNRQRLLSEPTYREIERAIFAEFISEGRRVPLPASDEVDTISFGAVCTACVSTRSQSGGSPLDERATELMRQALVTVYSELNPAQDVQRDLAQAVCDVVRTQDLDPLVPDGPRRQALRLESATSEQEVVAHVLDARLAECVVRAQHHKQEPFVAARGLLADAASHHPLALSIRALTQTLVHCVDPTRPILWRIATADAKRIAKHLQGEAFADRLAHELLRNPQYGDPYWHAVELRARVRESVPATPMEAFPLARAMTRHITLHVGPTNSGKTHDALQALAAVPSGAYLGPLRLLAYEQFEHLNRLGCACSLLTGEEAMEVPGARHVSSTVEMANYHTPIDVAVIDEAQMIADKSRGHHWANAILGIPAYEVHVCCAPHAEKVVSELVGLCGDELTVVRHERLVPLRPDKGGFRVPEDVQPGDALVVFSRRSVHAVASQVAATGLRASVVYGALPHDVRHEEARRFDAGETDVVVATDAIGMGMNLPIRRVVFVEQEKFDGVSKRMLRPEEVQQIAGRAGRYGRYDVGYYQSSQLRKEMARRYRSEVPPIDSVPVGIPQNIAYVRDETLSACIRQWMTLEQPEPFHRIGISRDLALIDEVERRLPEERRTNTDDKLLVYALATMAFDEHDRTLYATWLDMVDAELQGEELAFEVPDLPGPGSRLIAYEGLYRYCDLLYTYARTFGHPQNLELLNERREEISHAIMESLAG